MDCGRKQNCPTKVALIIDETTDIDLARLISISIDKMFALMSLALRKVQLVFAGVGLDAIKTGSRVGTNPSVSH